MGEPAINAELNRGSPGEMLEALAKLPTQLFLEVVEQSSIAITITDPAASIIYCNPAFSALTGYSRESLIGRNHSIVASHQTPEERYQSLWDTVIKKQPWQGRLINRKRDGSVYLAEVTITPVIDAYGQITHFLGMQQDISQRYELEQQVRNRSNLLEAVLNSAPMALALVDEQQSVLLDNLAYKTLRADLDGAEPLEVLLASRKAQRQEQTADQRAEDLVWISINGEVRWFSLTFQRFEEVNEQAGNYFSAGVMPHHLILIEDHTAREQHLQQERLDRLRHAVGDEKMLIAVRQAIQAAAFKLQAPLNMLQAVKRLGNINMETLSVVLEEGERTLESLQSRVPEAQREEPETVAPGTLLRDVLSLIQPKLDRAGVTLETACAARLPGFRCQRISMLTGMELLLSHAIATATAQEDGVVRIAVRRFDEHLLIEVEDNVPPPEGQALHQILKPLLPSGQGEAGGLSLVKEIVENHHGILELGLGSLGGYRRTLRLPLQGYREEKKA